MRWHGRCAALAGRQRRRWCGEAGWDASGRRRPAQAALCGRQRRWSWEQGDGACARAAWHGCARGRPASRLGAPRRGGRVRTHTCARPGPGRLGAARRSAGEGEPRRRVRARGSSRGGARAQERGPGGVRAHGPRGGVLGWGAWPGGAGGEGGPGQARASEEKGRRAGRAARQRRERKEEGERKRKEEKKMENGRKKKKRRGEREERALAGGIRGGRCDPVGHAQCCVRARMRPQEKDRGRESDVRNGLRDFQEKGLGFKSILSSTIRSFANNYFSV